jgi:hypothetical protein
VSYLTDIKFGMAVYASMSAAAESQCVDQALDDLDTTEASLAAFERGWRMGDPSPWVKELAHENRDYPDCNAAIRGAKLKAFLDGIEPLFDGGKTTFVVVDAFDLADSDGIPAVLASRGIAVTQM